MTTSKQNIKILKKVLMSSELTRQEYIRVQAVFLNLAGYSHKEIKDINGKSEDAIKEWITNFNQQGLDGLKTQPVIEPHHHILTIKQKDKIKQLINKHDPRYFKLTDEFWSVASLKQFIKKKFNKEYQSRKAYIDILTYCGFSYQKVEFKDSRANEDYKKDMKLRLQKKLKKGVLRMY